MQDNKLKEQIISLYLNIGQQANKQLDELKNELNNALNKLNTTQNCVVTLNEFLNAFFSNQINATNKEITNEQSKILIE